ncbi:prepilin-type N-terminal cleavage/methylation domain-containing protein [bacterium]|nr:prepilin-type N-terminal cleavage/methylation domain-containing protein [bacterium]
MSAEKGFTLLELLISVVLVVLVILSASMLFTQAQWYHLSAEKRSDTQNHARVVIENMERDLRMIGYGVPTGSDVGGATTYTETWDAIIAATSTSISFTADIDSGNTILTADAASTAADEISVENATYYSDVAANPLEIILVNNGKQWADLTINGISGNILSASANIPSPTTFSSNKSEVFTLERVFYRMTGDADNNGICDTGYPFCTVERQEFITNDPTEETAVTGLWQTLGENVYSLNLEYQDGNGGTFNPPAAGDLPNIEKIVITLVCRNRWLRIGDYQSVTLTSNVLIRNRAL